jgi:hypothetical protein
MLGNHIGALERIAGEGIEPVLQYYKYKCDQELQQDLNDFNRKGGTFFNFEDHDE